MSGFEGRLRELLEKVRARAEREGIQWRKADDDVYAFRAGPYVVTFARERDPQLAIYDENGEELEAIDRADLEHLSGEGASLTEIKGRVWRLARRGAGVSAAALDRVLDWLDERVEETAPPNGAHAAPEAPAPEAEASVADAEPAPPPEDAAAEERASEDDDGGDDDDIAPPPDPDFAPQAPQAGLSPQANVTPQANQAPNGGTKPPRPTWAI